MSSSNVGLKKYIYVSVHIFFNQFNSYNYYGNQKLKHLARR